MDDVDRLYPGRGSYLEDKKVTGTIVILISVLRDLAEEKKIQGSYQDYLYAKDYNGNPIPRLQLSELDNDALMCILEKKHRRPSHPIFDCYAYFKNRIKKKRNYLKI